jgi:very-short-patch-repair endonuclease
VSKQKELLETILYSINPDFEKEFRFHKTRKWRFDWCYPEQKIAIEFEGIFSTKSRHTTVKGYSRDAEKYNQATLHGWSVYRFTAIMVDTAATYDLLKEVLACRSSGPDS